MRVGVVLAEVPVDADAVDRRVGDHDRLAVLVAHRFDDVDVRVAELLREVAHGAASRGLRARELVVDDQEATLHELRGTTDHGVPSLIRPRAESRAGAKGARSDEQSITGPD